MNEESKSYYLSKEAVRKIEHTGSISLNLKNGDGSIDDVIKLGPIILIPQI